MTPWTDVPKARVDTYRTFACAYCFNSKSARGSLGGLWLYCDHPESFKRFVRYDQTCECWESETPSQDQAVRAHWRNALTEAGQ